MARRLAVALASVLLVFAAAELLLPLVPPRLGTLRKMVVPTDDARGYALRPGTRHRFRGMFESLDRPVLWTINEQGLRDDRPRIGPPGDRYRVAAYGDSETYGWSVALEDSFQRRMEAIDPRVEVLNFGVPGYNVVNIAETAEVTLPVFRPDLCLYLVSENDFDRALEVSPAVWTSEVLMRARFLWQVVWKKPERKRLRRSEERARVFGAHLDRLTRACEARGAPVLLGFLRWKDTRALAYSELFGDPAEHDRGPWRRVVNVKPAVKDAPTRDDHLVEDSQRRIAALLCETIAGGGSGCVPPGWSPARRARSRPERARQATRP